MALVSPCWSPPRPPCPATDPATAVFRTHARVRADTLLTDREVRSFLARQDATMKELAHKFAPRIKQNPQNKARLMQLLEVSAIMIEDPKRGVVYALKK